MGFSSESRALSGDYLQGLLFFGVNALSDLQFVGSRVN